MNSKIAVILNNIGSPKSPSPENVGLYLKRFLMDKRVITLPFIIRWILVHLIIVPKRKFASSEKYKKVWLSSGSPLVSITNQFSEALQKCLPANYKVYTAMRYSSPDIEEQMTSLYEKGFRKFIFAPMYPQNAAATTESSLEEWRQATSRYRPDISTLQVREFYDQEFYIQSLSAKIRPYLDREPKRHLLFSFHGLPMKQDAGYSSQCHSTARSCAKVLGLTDSEWSISFQSRIGRLKWIPPYTEQKLKEIGSSGQSLLVACPSFVADCLETLEEIAIEGKEIFIEAGGKDFEMIPALNADPQWAQFFASYLCNMSNFSSTAAKEQSI